MGEQPLDSAYSLRTRGLLVLLACASFALAVAAFYAAQRYEYDLEANMVKAGSLAQSTPSVSDREQGENLSGLSGVLNPFVDSKVTQKRVLLSRFFDLDEQYQSMYFDKEREILRSQLVLVLQKLISLAPFDSRYAKRLFQTYSSSEDDDSDFAWLISRTYSLLKWNPNQYRYIARQCVEQYQRLQTLSANACANVISDVATNNDVKQLSRILKQDHDQLAKLYQATGLNFEFKRQ